MAEQWNQTLVEEARAMLEEKFMPWIYWSKAIRTTVYIQNSTSGSRIGNTFGYSATLCMCKCRMKSRRNWMQNLRSASLLDIPTSKRCISATTLVRRKSELAVMSSSTNQHFGTSHHPNPRRLLQMMQLILE